VKNKGNILLAVFAILFVAALVVFTTVLMRDDARANKRALSVTDPRIGRVYLEGYTSGPYKWCDGSTLIYNFPGKGFNSDLTELVTNSPECA